MLCDTGTYCPVRLGYVRDFLNPNHSYCVAEAGYLAGKAGPLAPDREYSKLGSCLTGGAILYWPIAHEIHNSVLFSVGLPGHVRDSLTVAS